MHWTTELKIMSLENNFLVCVQAMVTENRTSDEGDYNHTTF